MNKREHLIVILIYSTHPSKSDVVIKNIKGKILLLWEFYIFYHLNKSNMCSCSSSTLSSSSSFIYLPIKRILNWFIMHFALLISGFVEHHVEYKLICKVSILFCTATCQTNGDLRAIITMTIFLTHRWTINESL